MTNQQAPEQPAAVDARAALKPFADCCDWIDAAEDDEEWTKFRLLVGDYRRAKAAFDRLSRLSPPQGTEQGEDDPEEAYQLGKRDGFAEAAQRIDMLTGGDGEYRYCLGMKDSERHCPDEEAMIARIVERCHPSPAAGVGREELILTTLSTLDATGAVDPDWIDARKVASSVVDAILALLHPSEGSVG